jgi:hypothetical protein
MGGILMKKVLSITLVLVLFLAQSAFARYTDVQTITATLSVDSLGIASCKGTVKPYDANIKSSVKVSLMQKVGSVWKEYAVWNGSGTGFNGASASGTKQLTKGYIYKVVTVGTISDLNGNILESVSKDSAEVGY